MKPLQWGRTPRGTYRTFIINTPSAAGQIAAAGMVAGGAYTISNIQNQLDSTRAALENEIVQTTTVEPQGSYAGRIVIEQPADHRLRNWPQPVHLAVHFNGEDYPFTFQVARAPKGTSRSVREVRPSRADCDTEIDCRQCLSTGDAAPVAMGRRRP